nr:dr1-associated corepressor [Quercus suber]
MRKKLDTRFPAARIKKIMQADEDIGKIAMAVPPLVSKALELFLQDLCAQTYEITLKRGAKTMNSLHFKVPDLGGSEGAGEYRSVAKRRKITDNVENDSDDESKRHKMWQRRSDGALTDGMGCLMGFSMMQSTVAAVAEEGFEDDPDDSEHDEKLNQSLERLDNGSETKEWKENILAVKSEEAPVRNFDLNMDLDENGDSTTAAAVPASSSAEPIPEIKPEEYPDWSESEMKNIAIDPVRLANLSRRIDEDEDEEDYDEEG